MSEPNHYSYIPLNNAGAQIRLLKVHFDVKIAAGHKNGHVLAGSMRNYYLPASTLSRTRRVVRGFQLPSFYALSYVWGDPTRTHEILLDGKRLRITENLYNAIRDLQRDSIGDIYVWADAICINQDDLAERSAQILLMREVYHSASDVSIWLGLSTDDGKRCMRFVSDLVGDLYYHDYIPDENSNERFMKALLVPTAAILKPVLGLAQGITQLGDVISPGGRDDKAVLVLDSDGDQKTVEEFIKWRPSNRDLKKVEGENFAEIANLIDLTFIQRCGWFERMWVVQELGVADYAAILYDGKTISWENFLRVTYYLHYTCQFPLPSIQKLTGLEKIRMGWNDRKRLSLYDLIRECQYRQSSDPKDRIYALLGLMGDRMNSLLQPDYTKSVGEVYSLATQHFIKQSESLDSICGWQTYGRREIPSWIPDYTLDQGKAASPLTINYGRKSLFSASGYDHRGKYSLDAVVLGDWRYLHVTGLCLDSISMLSASAPANASLGSMERTWQSTILESGQLLQKSGEDLKPSLNSVSSTVSKYSEFWVRAGPTRSYARHSNYIENLTLADNISQHHDLKFDTPNSENINVIEEYFQTLLCGRGTTKTRLGEKDIQAIMNLTLPEAPTDVQNDTIRTICKSLENGMKNRVMGVTSKGYFGALPEQARMGDFAFVLLGCSVPVILRKLDEDNSYMFIGECYLNGFMDGEAIAMQQENELTECDIILK